MIPPVAAYLLLTTAVLSAGQGAPPVTASGKIYVEPMGQDHEALRFRKLLSDGLSKAGLPIVKEAAEADLVLSSTLSTPVVSGDSRALASVALTNRQGQTIWDGEFPSSKRWPSGRDYVKRLAEEIVAALHKVVTRAG